MQINNHTMSNRLVRQLSTMKHAGVNPRAEWVEKNRSLLLSQIKNTVPVSVPKQTFENIWSGLSIFIPRPLVYQVVRPIAVLLVVAFVATRIVSDVDAAYEALPGDLWYPAKIAAEKTQLTVAGIMGDKNTQTKLHIKFAQNRASEAAKILRTNDPDKVAKVSATVANLKDELTTINASLSKDQVSVKQIPAEVVKDVHETTAQIQTVLIDASKDILANASTSITITNEIKDTNNLIKDTSIKAVEVLVDKHLQGDSAVTPDDVNKAVSTTIDTVVNEVAQTKQSVDSTKNVVENVKSEMKDLAQTAGKTSDPTGIVSTTKALTAQLTTVASDANRAAAVSLEADRKVTEAKVFLGTGDLAQAVDKIREASQATQELQKISDATLQKAQQVLPIVQIIKDAGTSTLPVIVLPPASTTPVKGTTVTPTTSAPTATTSKAVPIKK